MKETEKKSVFIYERRFFLMEDKQLIRLLFSRSESALVILRERFGKALYSIAMNILGNHHDAEEVTDDTYLAVWNAIPPKEPDPLASYVYRTGRNMALKRLEYLSAEKRNSRYDLSLDELSQYLPHFDDAEHIFSAKELADSINDFLERDTEQNRYIFIRRYWYGDTPEDIAAELNIKSGAVYVRLSRIRERLKKKLIKEGFYYEA